MLKKVKSLQRRNTLRRLSDFTLAGLVRLERWAVSYSNVKLGVLKLFSSPFNPLVGSLFVQAKFHQYSTTKGIAVGCARGEADAGR